MYSVLPTQSSVAFVPVAATSSPSLHRTNPVSSNPFDGQLSAFIDGCVDYTAAQNAVAASPVRSVTDGGACFVASPRLAAAERSTPLKPAKRDRAADDEDCRILRCKRSLASSLNTASASRLDGGSQQSPSSSTFSASESVERRNLRERRRVKLINVTFATLRNRLPSYCWQQRHLHRHRQQQQQHRDRRQQHDGTGAAGRSSSKKPSKVDTLRTAINYIRCLQQLLADDDRQRLSTFQTFNAADTDTVVPCHHWVTSPATAAGYDSCSPATSASNSSSEDLTTSTTVAPASTSTSAKDRPDFTHKIIDRDVAMSPIPDILDWFI